MAVSEHFLHTKPSIGYRFVFMLRKGSDFSEESIEKSWGKNRLMKAVRSSSHVLIVPSFSSSSHVFASPVSDKGNIITRTTSFLVSVYLNLSHISRNSSRSDNTVDNPHRFAIHGIEVLKGNEKATEVIDVENWRVDNSRLLRYLKGKPQLGLWYLKDSLFNLVAYFDCDYAGASLDKKSTKGGCQFLGCILISWQCKKQTVVGTSLTEAEYVAVASCCAQVLWIQNQLLDYGNEALAIPGQMETDTQEKDKNKAKTTKPNTEWKRSEKTKLFEAESQKSKPKIVDFLNAHTIRYALVVNPPIYVSCIKQFWAAVSVKKTNDVVKLQALNDRKKVVLTEDTIRQDLQLDDVDGVECLPNEEIFAELPLMGYEKPPPKLTFYKAFFSAQWNMVRNLDSPCKFLMYPRFLQVMINAQIHDLSSHTTKYTSHTLTQKVFANMRRIGKGFSRVETPLFDTMLVQPQVQDVAKVEEDEDDEEQPTHTSESLMTLLNTLMETCATLTQKVTHLEQDKVAQALEITKLKQRVRKLETKRRSKHSGLKRLRKGEIAELDADEDVTLVDVDTTVEIDANIQGRMKEDVTAVKEINVAESELTVFNDEEVTMTMAQTLIKMKAKKARSLDEQMAKRLQDEEIEQVDATGKLEKEDLERAKVLQQQYDQNQENIDWNIVAKQMQKKHLDNIKKYQSLKRKPISVAQARKNMIVYLKNMAGYKIQHFKGMTYNQVRPIFEREYNSVQTFLKSDRDEEPTKKRAAKETMLQESFQKLRKEAEVSVKERFSTTMPTVDKEKALWAELTRLYEPNADDVFRMLQRYMHYLILWKLHSNCGVHQVSSTTRRYDIYMLVEKDYPLPNQVMTLMLSLRLQVEEDSEVAKDLVMKVFLKANQPKSKILDTSSN
nr:uncharacterized mitochondrial protein AtMg00810-like [Tanacetum cinerariifolium]